jgi:hypothetical protein
VGQPVSGASPDGGDQADQRPCNERLEGRRHGCPTLSYALQSRGVSSNLRKPGALHPSHLKDSVLMLKGVAHLRWRRSYQALRARLASVCCQCKSSPPSFFLSGIRVEGLSLANNRPEVFLQSNNFEMLHALAPKYGANVPVLSRICSNPEEVGELPKVYLHSIAGRSDPELAMLVSTGQVSRRVLMGLDRNVV